MIQSLSSPDRKRHPTAEVSSTPPESSAMPIAPITAGLRL